MGIKIGTGGLSVEWIIRATGGELYTVTGRGCAADSSALPKQQNVAASAPIRVRLKPGRYILLSRESALTGIGSFPRHLSAERRR